MRGYVLCRQLSWQNFSFYFVLNLDTGPLYSKHIFLPLLFCLSFLLLIFYFSFSYYRLSWHFLSTVFHTTWMDFPFGHCSRLISPHTQYYFSCWVFLPFLLSLYPKHFISLGISSVLLSLYPKYFISLGISSILTLFIPKTFHLFGYFFRFYSLYTQNISSLWVFLPFLPSLYPKHFIFLGISPIFTLSIPNPISSLGYTGCFLLLIPQMPCSMCIQWHTIVQFSGSPTQEESCSSGFSACGWSHQRHNSTPPQCAPARRAILFCIGKSTGFPIKTIKACKNKPHFCMPS